MLWWGSFPSLPDSDIESKLINKKWSEVRKRLAQSGKSALGEKADGMLAFVQLVTDKSAIRFLGNIVGSIQDPKDAGRHPNRTAEWHKKKCEAAKDRADQKIRCSSSPAGDGLIT